MDKRYAFGPFTLDGALGVLMRDAQPSSLGPRASALLQVLLENAQRPVGKDALLEAGWPGLVVEESNLSVQIAALRKVLGEAGGAAWIETLPRRGYRYIGPAVRVLASSPVALDPAASIPSRPSLAVMPFTSLGAGEDGDYFADGMTDDIVNGLSRIRWLVVIARSSTLNYRGRPDIQATDVGRELGVRYVLQGSVRRAADRVRVASHLVDGATGLQVWSERYDRRLTDVFDLQDDVAIAVVGAIEPTLRQEEARRVRRKRPDNLDAYELVLRAQSDVFRGMPEPSTRALELIERALILEPDYALAHAYAAMCHHNRFLRGGLDESDRAASIRHAIAAMANGQDDALALTFAAFSLGLDGPDRAAALAGFDAALAISPSSALTYTLGGVVRGWSGQAESAIEWGTTGLRLSPFDAWTFAARHAVALGHFKLQRFEDAFDAATRAIQANPAHSISYMLQAAALSRLGRHAEAMNAARSVTSLQPNFGYGRHLDGVACETKLAEELSAALARAGLPP